LDLDLIIVVVVLLASKSCVYLFSTTEASYTSLGRDLKSKTCASTDFSSVFQKAAAKVEHGG
jgi:hypothetical protein